MLFYPSALPLSSRTVVFTAGVIRRHRVRIGSPWRKLNATEQALLVLVYLRKGETFADLAAGFGIGTATVAVRDRDGGATRRPITEAPHGTRGSKEGRARLHHHRRHVSSHRPRRGRPAVLLG